MFSESTIHKNNFCDSLSAHSRHPTIVSLAKNYRVRYVQMIKEKIIGSTTSQTEKRCLESPTTMAFKRQRTSSNYVNTLQTLRNRIEHEENEQFFFNDERRMS